MFINSFSIVYLISKFVSLSIKENELIVIVDLGFACRLTESFSLLLVGASVGVLADVFEIHFIDLY
jgi:hypothetical protein